MNYFTTTLFSLLMIAALMIPGYILKKVNLVSDKAVKDFSSVLLYIGMPMLLFETMLKSDIASVSWLNILLCVLFSVSVHFIGVIFGYIICRGGQNPGKSVCAFCSAFANCGFLGIPLAAAVVPEEFRAEALLYVAVYNIVFNCLSWIVSSIVFVEREKRSISSLVKAVFNPCTFAFLLALPFMFAPFELLEVAYIGKFIGILSGIGVPVSMLVLGFRVANIRFVSSLKNNYVYKNSFVRLIAVPLISIGILLLLKLIPGVNAAFITAMAVMASLPTAATAIAFAERFKSDSLLASELVVSSTAFSIITVPLMLLLASLII